MRSGVQVEPEDQLTHEIQLDAADLKADAALDIFKADTEYAQHEKEYEVRCPSTAELHSPAALKDIKRPCCLKTVCGSQISASGKLAIIRRSMRISLEC